MHACTTFTLIHVYLYIGQSVPDKASSISQLPSDVLEYVTVLKKRYQDKPIVATDSWPPSITGQCYFGRLGLVEKQEKQGFDGETEKNTSWHMLRGEIDKIPKLSGIKEIPIEKVLETEDSQSLRVVVDGPPGIGKTTLCRKIFKMWSNGEIKQYDLVLYCTLRDSKIAEAKTLAELLKAVYKSDKVSEVDNWLSKSEGKGLLIIFDGWDELDEQSRKSSLAADLFERKLLNNCAVIITSRSYASSSLLEMDTHSKHVQVIGFSEKEVNTVIINTLQKDDEESKDSQLAEQLIDQLNIRTDVQSLCYIPLVCSMVIFVYSKEKKLPKTLTRLYETFILYTIKRHIKKRHSEIDHKRIQSLNNLPSLVEPPFKEMCRLAYTSLKNETNKMTFSSDQLHKDCSLSEAAKEDYFGLMTVSFEDPETEWYQFVHLSIQEFLAAWWIVYKHDKESNTVFNYHFDDDHFRLCLRFVAGLTHLEHQNYQKYFKEKQLDLQCKTRPWFGFSALHDSYFTKNPRTGHINSVHFDKLPILLLQLLYESQNTALCEVLAKSIKESSLCLHEEKNLSSFDMMCLSFFINNSNVAWNHLDLKFFYFMDKKSSTLVDGLISNKTLETTTSNNLSCKRCEIQLYKSIKKETFNSLLQQSHLLHNLEEFYFTGNYIPFCTFSLSEIKVLHIALLGRDYGTSDGSELQKCIESNTTLQELNFDLFFIELDSNTLLDYIINGVIKGLKKNESIKSFFLLLDPSKMPSRLSPLPVPLPANGVIVDLLKCNKTLKALSLSGIPYCSPPSLNIEEVNTPLTALHIDSEMAASLLPHTKKLQHLTLRETLPLWSHELYGTLPLRSPELYGTLPLRSPKLKDLLSPLFSSLQTLDLDLYNENATDLFNMLPSNTTLKGLNVRVEDERDDFHTSLQNMLAHNQTLQCLRISIMNNAYLPFLRTGLQKNNSLQQLAISIELYPDNDNELITFLNVISEKKNLTELDLYFIIDSLLHLEKNVKLELRKTLFHEQVLPAIKDMLQSHTTMRVLEMEFSGIIDTDAFVRTIQISHHTCTDQFRSFYKTIFNHASLEYVSIYNEVILEETFKEQEKARLQLEAPH